ncbi:DNA damage-responsive transcriptional repressor RPH1 [Histoplasma capsulatum]|uniref:DNA damage-responsive transcriptional repressor RPH1 n=1 Tax=Ajellomyces capsulatus TaxID=5037 RepID=A0A8A1M1W4_AJECA|nr:DNA damage-responsive transcriptional repressor RPH1 [Histoplasma capsulatum]
MLVSRRNAIVKLIVFGSISVKSNANCGANLHRNTTMKSVVIWTRWTWTGFQICSRLPVASRKNPGLDSRNGSARATNRKLNEPSYMWLVRRRSVVSSVRTPWITRNFFPRKMANLMPTGDVQLISKRRQSLRTILALTLCATSIKFPRPAWG